MTRFAIAVLAASAMLAPAVAPAPSRGATVVYDFAALPGPVSNCRWFDAHLNDRSEGALAQLSDLLYNRAALEAPTPVQITQTGSSEAGAPISAFRYDGRLLCAQSEAVTPPTPVPAASTAP